MAEADFDVVVIGSGLGGLTAAALMAKAGRRVCLIERNPSLGGAASCFKHGTLTIEASLHQTADPRDPNETKHAILEHLGVLEELDLVPIAPFSSVHGGPVGERFDLPVGFGPARDALGARFPASRDGFDGLLGAMQTLYEGVGHLTRARTDHPLGNLVRAGAELRGLLGDWRVSADQMLQRFLGDDEAAKYAVAANIGYYADDPRRLAWPFFAIAHGGFFAAGGVYVKGGSRVLSMKLAKVVRQAGGSVLLGREAVGIDLDAEGRPAGVRHVGGRPEPAEERLGARQILANCAPNVLAGMLPEPARGACERAYGGQPLSTSLFSAHFGLATPPAQLGLDRYLTVRLPEWTTSLRDSAASARLMADDPGGRLPQVGIANYGAIDSGLSEDGPTLVSVVGLDRFDNWAGLSVDEEKDRRARWLDALQGALDKDYPGFGAAVSERVFLNARSMHNYLNTPQGAVYGFAPLPPTRGIWAGIPRSPRTPVPGIFLASAFGGFGGFSGAMRAGADAAEAAMGA